MTQQVLITGGAGFFGSHLSDELLARGHRVRALDSLAPQVHGEHARRPEYLDPDVELLIGDVRDADVVRRALKGVDAVYHFAAVVGVGQSMYEVSHYTDVNNGGTAVLLEALIRQPVQRLVVASSMSLYGEGLYSTPTGEVRTVGERSLDQLRRADWEWRDSDGSPLSPIPTPEHKTPALASVYALSKFDQERLCLMIGRAYNIPTVALRFFNAYGPRQALSNPYTGVLAIFAARLLNDGAPPIFEDGLQRRDFVAVSDVARAFALALEGDGADGLVLNVGSGTSVTVREVAVQLAATLGKEIEPELTGEYRAGDIRHCFADVTRARETLGYEPQVSLADGMRELAGWLEGRVAVDRVEAAAAELKERGLAI
ncbi:MAG: NAD-dependent epimerase/dehydratase family protein [Burkholderiales bacterium]